MLFYSVARYEMSAMQANNSEWIIPELITVQKIAFFCLALHLGLKISFVTLKKFKH